MEGAYKTSGGFWTRTYCSSRSPPCETLCGSYGTPLFSFIPSIPWHVLRTPRVLSITFVINRVHFPPAFLHASAVRYLATHFSPGWPSFFFGHWSPDLLRIIHISVESNLMRKRVIFAIMVDKLLLNFDAKFKFQLIKHFTCEMTKLLYVNCWGAEMTPRVTNEDTYIHTLLLPPKIKGLFRKMSGHLNNLIKRRCRKPKQMKDHTSSRIVLDQKPCEMLYEEWYKLLNWNTLQHRREYLYSGGMLDQDSVWT